MGNMSRIVGIDLGTTTSEIAYIRMVSLKLLKMDIQVLPHQ